VRGLEACVGWGGGLSWIPDGFLIFFDFLFFLFVIPFFITGQTKQQRGDMGPGAGPSKERSRRHA
jgi:hypothetical protein